MSKDDLRLNCVAKAGSAQLHGEVMASCAVQLPPNACSMNIGTFDMLMKNDSDEILRQMNRDEEVKFTVLGPQETMNIAAEFSKFKTDTIGSQRKKTQALEHQAHNDALVSKMNAVIALDKEGFDPTFEIPSNAVKESRSRRQRRRNDRATSQTILSAQINGNMSKDDLRLNCVAKAGSAQLHGEVMASCAVQLPPNACSMNIGTFDMLMKNDSDEILRQMNRDEEVKFTVLGPQETMNIAAEFRKFKTDTIGSQRQKTHALEHQTPNDALVSKMNAAIALDEEGFDPTFEIPKQLRVSVSRDHVYGQQRK